MANYFKLNRTVFNASHWPTNNRKKGILIRSEEFPGVLRYVVKEDSLILLSGSHGVFCFDLDAGEVLLGEIGEIVDCYKR